MTATRPDPQPSDWLLRSRYAGERLLVTRTRRRPFTLGYGSDGLTVTTPTGTRLMVNAADFESDWMQLAANPQISPSRLSQTGSYAQAIYDDLHAPLADRDHIGPYSVYAIQLDEGAWADADMRSKNPAGDLSKPCVYVGYTGETVWTRFQKHLTGKRFSKRVRRFGLRPLPELYQALNPLANKKQALAVEEALAQALRAAGFRVWEGQLGALHIEKPDRRDTKPRAANPPPPP